MSGLPLAKKALGQHWLEDTEVLQYMVKVGEVTPAIDTILEIGPGTGTLTEKLAESGAKVVALEFDEERYTDLLHKFKNVPNVRVQKGDIRRYDFSVLPVGYKIIANIPYYLTANLLRFLSEIENKPSIAVLLVQKEVAERISAQPGNLSKVAVFTQMAYLVKLGRVVPASLFVPPPKVDSQIVILSRRQDAIKSNPNLERLIKAGFFQKRKKLVNNLAGCLSVDKLTTLEALDELGLGQKVRAQELSIEQWQQLAEIILD